MTVNIHQLIAAICPDIYCAPGSRSAVKEALRVAVGPKKALAYAEAAAVAKLMESSSAAVPENPFTLQALKEPVTRHVFVRDAMDESLEAFYFQLLNLFGDDPRWHVTKLADIFEPSPGAALGADFQRRSTSSRQDADKLIKASRELVSSILGDHERLKDEHERMRQFEAAVAPEARRRETALVALKQHWLETLDRRRGSMSILRLNTQFRDRDLLGHFMEDDEPASAVPGAKPDWLDHTLRLRKEEFQGWVNRSGSELRQLHALHRQQLRHDLELLTLHAGWLAPTLHQANRPGIAASNAALVSAFDTSLLRLMLLAVGDLELEERRQSGELPAFMCRPGIRGFKSVLIIEVHALGSSRGRGIGEHQLRGRIEVRITSYGLADDEVETLRREFVRGSVQETIQAIGNTAQETVRAITELVDEFLGPDCQPPAKDVAQEPGLFSTLWGMVKSVWRWLTDGSPGRSESTSPRRDGHVEKVLRSLAIQEAAQIARAAFAGLKGESPGQA